MPIPDFFIISQWQASNIRTDKPNIISLLGLTQQLFVRFSLDDFPGVKPIIML